MLSPSASTPNKSKEGAASGNRAPQRSLPGAVPVVVFIGRRIVAQQHKLIRVTPVAESRHGAVA